ncbi:ATPase family AAA domain-containing protein 2-like [Rhea pennata]|uniref:ATPase family AAA domain-containing protein 2-like n=1 Tax=Rhea pennata TaxID=8795 RepID=UPI002E261604
MVTPASWGGEHAQVLEKEEFQHFTRANQDSPCRLFRSNELLSGTALAGIEMGVTVRFDGVGGLSHHISALKEMVLFPLLYPEFFERFQIRPPRGCLFYGPPGTGKTLVAQALANECRQGDKQIAFFMRKGADCLSQWVGESERQLRSLFQQAYEMRPSIIFFDEIDGLAPARSSRQDQIHSSLVTTLLALMDGLDSRGEIVVIGATNRPDSLDPALRRPGRFDRELLFTRPNKEARKEIFQIHTRDWSPKPPDALLDELAEKCVGYCGADIQSLCAEAALCALHRRYPQIYTSSQKLQIDVAAIEITATDFLVAMRKTAPASQRAVASPGQPLSPISKPLLQNTLERLLKGVQRVFPHAALALKKDRQPAACRQKRRRSTSPSESLAEKRRKCSPRAETEASICLWHLLNVAGKATRDCNIRHLEKLHLVLSQCVYRHRQDDDKTRLIEGATLSMWRARSDGKKCEQY